MSFIFSVFSAAKKKEDQKKKEKEAAEKDGIAPSLSDHKLGCPADLTNSDNSLTGSGNDEVRNRLLNRVGVQAVRSSCFLISF